MDIDRMNKTTITETEFLGLLICMTLSNKFKDLREHLVEHYDCEEMTKQTMKFVEETADGDNVISALLIGYADGKLTKFRKNKHLH
jgi:hypothetical protein